MAFPWDLCGGSSTENDLSTTSRIAEEECHRGTHLSSPLGPLLHQPVTVLVYLHPDLPENPSNSLSAFLSSVSVPSTTLRVCVKVTGACLAAGTWGRKNMDGREDLVLSQWEECVCRC